MSSSFLERGFQRPNQPSQHIPDKGGGNDNGKTENNSEHTANMRAGKSSQDLKKTILKRFKF